MFFIIIRCDNVPTGDGVFTGVDGSHYRGEWRASDDGDGDDNDNNNYNNDGDDGVGVGGVSDDDVAAGVVTAVNRQIRCMTRVRTGVRHGYGVETWGTGLL
jgi:hypothetical protein